MVGLKWIAAFSLELDFVFDEPEKLHCVVFLSQSRGRVNSNTNKDRSIRFRYNGEFHHRLFNPYNSLVVTH